MHAYHPLLSVFIGNFGIVKFGPLWDRFHSHRVGSALVRREAIFHFRPERVSQGCGMYAYGLVHVYIKGKSPNFETYGILAIWNFRVGSALVPRWFGAMLFRQIWGVEKKYCIPFRRGKSTSFDW